MCIYIYKYVGVQFYVYTPASSHLINSIHPVLLVAASAVPRLEVGQSPRDWDPKAPAFHRPDLDGTLWGLPVT